MYFIATSSFVSLCLRSRATPKLPAPKSLTTSYLSIWAQNQREEETQKKKQRKKRELGRRKILEAGKEELKMGSRVGIRSRKQNVFAIYSWWGQQESHKRDRGRGIALGDVTFERITIRNENVSHDRYHTISFLFLSFSSLSHVGNWNHPLFVQQNSFFSFFN